MPRQAHYEYFFFGDPRAAGGLLNGNDRTPYMDAVRDFLARSENATG
ncbi:MAG: hypothetical protein R3E79_38035 [Caldilineaceae bacterium]